MKPIVTFDDYAKIEVRVGRITAAEVPEGSEKLIKLTVNFGEFEKIIFSGIKQWYTPEELVGVKTIFIVNLAPKKTPFGYSEGMLFAVDTIDHAPYIVRIDDSVLEGSEFH